MIMVAGYGWSVNDVLKYFVGDQVVVNAPWLDAHGAVLTISEVDD